MWDLKRVLLLEGTTTNHHGFNSIHFSFLFGEKKVETLPAMCVCMWLCFGRERQKE